MTGYRVTLIVAIVAVALVSIGGVVGVAIYGSPNNSTPIITSILGFGATILVSIFALLKGEKFNQDLQETKKKVTSTEEKVDRAEHKIDEAKDVLAAEHSTENIVRIAIEADRIIQDSKPFPTTIEELDLIIRRSVDEACTKMEVTRHQMVDIANEQHVIKHALRNICSIMEMKEEVKKLESKSGRQLI